MYLRWRFSVFIFLITFFSHCSELQNINIFSGFREHSVASEKKPRLDIYNGYALRKPPLDDEQTIEEMTGASSAIPHCESQHKYFNFVDSFQCIFEFEQKSDISIHFENFQTEPGYDFVFIYDEHKTLVTMFHGNLGNFWTEPIAASKIILTFHSDISRNEYGFKIDKIRRRHLLRTKKEDSNNYHEIETHLESQHGAIISPGKKWSDEVFIKQPGASEIQIHFSSISINQSCIPSLRSSPCPAVIKIFNGAEKLQKSYSSSSNLKDLWVTIPGDKVHIDFEILTRPWILGGTSVVGDYGYKIDRLRVKSNFPIQKYTSRYPIVLAHGFLGFQSFMGMDYFFRVKKYLQDKGYEVYETEVPPVSSIQARAESLEKQILSILEKSSTENGRKIDKIHFIAHSMGGLDGRVLISQNTMGISGSSDPRYHIYGKNMGDNFASFVTIGTPHHGTYLADILQGWIPSHDVRKIAFLLFNNVAAFYNYPNLSEEEVIAASFNLTTKFCDQFNIDHPEPLEKGIHYMAFAGITNPPLSFREGKDQIIPVLYPMYQILMTNPDISMWQNDGIIPFKSARWKDEYYRDYNGQPLNADHMKEVGQPFGQTNPWFNHLEFYYYIVRQLP